jgi:hypothetical protein
MCAMSRARRSAPAIFFGLATARILVPSRIGADVTRRSPRTLWSRPKTRVSSWCDDASIWFASARTSSPAARQAVARRQLFEHVRPEAFLELSDASQHGRVIHPEALGASPH